jgi:hypothetical protein
MTAAPLETLDGALIASEFPVELEMTDDEYVCAALGRVLGGVPIVDVWANTPFKEFSDGRQINGAMEVECRFRQGDTIGREKIWFQGDSQPDIDERTRVHLGKLAAHDWLQNWSIRWELGGNHFRLIHPKHYGAAMTELPVVMNHAEQHWSRG